MKPGWKTTEFWLVGVLPQLLSLTVLTGYFTPEQSVVVTEGVEVAIAGASSIWGALISMGGAFGYGVARGLAKMNTVE